MNLSIMKLCVDICTFVTLPMLRLLSSKHKDAKIFENHLNPVMLVFIGKLPLSSLKWIHMWQGFNHLLATSSIRVQALSAAPIDVLHKKWI